MNDIDFAMLSGFINEHICEADAVLAVVANEAKNDYQVEVFSFGSNRDCRDSLKKIFYYQFLGFSNSVKGELSKTFKPEVTEINIVRLRIEFLEWSTEYIHLSSAACCLLVRKGKDVYTCLFGNPYGVSLLLGSSKLILK